MSAPLVIERYIEADPAQVYSFLTDSDRWARWQGVEATIQARPQGLLAMTMGNGMRARGQFLELVPDHRVVFTWGWIDHPELPPGSTTVEIDLVPKSGGTLLVLTHRGLPEEEVPVHTSGWEHYLGRLGVVAGGADPGPDPGPA
ncbi:MAG: SRPBCC family protein [Acidimicrobiia bacterium]